MSAKPLSPPLPAAAHNGHPLLQLFTNTYLISFLLDGGLCLADSLFAGHKYPSLQALLSLIKGLNSLLVNCLVLLVLTFIGSYRNFPWRVLMPALLTSMWAGFLYLPLPGLLEWKNIEFLGAILTLIVGISIIALIRSHGPWFLLPKEAFVDIAFSWKRSIQVSFISLFLLLPASFLYIAVSCCWMLEWKSNGFLHLRMDGITTEARTYQNAGKSVYLLPTSHIAAESFYKELLTGLPAKGAVLLPEGVTDRNGRMKSHLSYTGAAKSAGLAEQPDFTRNLPSEVRHFDADVSEFSASTQALLNGAAKAFEQWTLGNQMNALETFSTLPSPDLDQLERDILELRNTKISTGIAESLLKFNNVLVPWGAAHMPGIERALLKAQFKQTAAREITVLEWSKLKLTLPDLRP